MGFAEILTLVLVVLKAFNVISCSWLIVFVPEIIAIVFYIFLVVISLFSTRRATKRMNKRFDDFSRGE